MVTVIFPHQFTRILNGQLHQVGEGASLRDVLTHICATRAELRKLLFLNTDEVSPFVGFAKLGDDSFYTSNMISTLPLAPGDSVEVVMSMAGG
jgi:hypothetical protein